METAQNNIQVYNLHGLIYVRECMFMHVHI